MGVAVPASPPVVSQAESELDFNDKAWAAARQQFKETLKKKHNELALDAFLRESCGPEEAKQYIQNVQKEKPQYNAGLGAILTKIDAFMKLGDVAIQSAPESIGLAWAGIRLCLHSVQDDFATFRQYHDACGDMIGILISCTVYAGMFGKLFAVKDFLEIHQQVKDCIPGIYAGMLDFNYSMHNLAMKPKALRVLNGLYRSEAAKQKGKFDAIKENEAKMRKLATTASEQLTQYYLKAGLENDDRNLETQISILNSLSELDATIRESVHAMEEGLKKIIIEGFNDLKKQQTPFEKAKKAFEENVQRLNPLMDHQRASFEETLKREPGTCLWIFKEKEYRDWHTSEKSSMLWLSAGPGFGKSFLMGSVIETLKKSEQQDENVAVLFFFCKNGNDSTQKSDKVKQNILYQLYQLAKDDPDTLEEANRLVSLFVRKTSKKPSDNSQLVDSRGKPATYVETYQGLARLLKKTVFLIIDALDEIRDRVDEAFLDDFLRISEITEVKLNILFGSRPVGDVEDSLSAVPAIEVRGRNEEDIRLNVNSLLSGLPRLSKSERALACDNIVIKADGAFRYVKSAIDFLKLPWSKPLSARLQKLERGLHNSYTQALQLTDPNYLELLRISLTWALLGEGKVTAYEVMDAFNCTYGEGDDIEDNSEIHSIESKQNNGDDWELTPLQKWALKEVEDAGSTFLDMKQPWKKGVIKPSHETVTEYFLDHKTDEKNHRDYDGENICSICKKEKDAGSRPFIITRKDGHLEIATTILHNLSSEAFWRSNFSKAFWNENFPVPEAKEVTAENVDEAVEPMDTQAVAAEVTVSVVNLIDETNLPGNESNSTSDHQVPAKKVLNGSGEYANNDIGTDKNSDGEAHVNSGSEAATSGISSGDVSEPPSSSLAKADSTVKTEVPEAATSPDTPMFKQPGRVVDGIEDGKDADTPPEEDHPDDVPDYDFSEDDSSEDDASEADSDVREDQRGDWSDWNPYLDETRHEVSHCIFHLQKLQELWTSEERKGPQFDQLRKLMRGFFRVDSLHFQKWIQIQTRSENSHFCWADAETLHPLYVAAAYGLTDLLRILIDSEDGKKPDANVLNRALQYAAHYYTLDDVVPFQILLDSHADPNSSGEDQGILTPFQMLILMNPKISIVKLFLAHDAQVDKVNEWSCGPMHYFAYSGSNDDIDVLHLLIENKGDINAEDSDGETPLHWFVRRRNPPLELLRELMANGADVNKNDKKLQKPLYEVCTEDNVDAAQILLQAGAEIHAADEDGTSALHEAAACGHTKTCQLLIENGADITKLDKRNCSPFLLACGSDNADTAMYLATQLKSEDSYIFSLKTESGKSPLHKAVGSGNTEVVKLLLEKIDVSAEINSQDTKRGHAPLHVAGLNGSTEIIEHLLASGASTTITDKKGHTPFQVCYKRWTESSSTDASAVLLLMDRESEESLKDLTLLNTAAVKGSVPVLTKLLDRGATLNHPDEHGWTPLQLASQYGHSDAVKLLSDRGVVIGRKPTGWICSVDTVKISEDKKVAEYIALDRNETGVLSDHPIPAGVKRYYYEIRITTPRERNSDTLILGLGLCNFPTKVKGWFPGWPNSSIIGGGSWGYHGDDGKLFTDKIETRVDKNQKFTHFGHGYVVGCGVDFETSELFFTRNGEKLPTAFKDIKGRLHPIVGMAQIASIEGNFGYDVVSHPFVWEKANVTSGGWMD